MKKILTFVSNTTPAIVNVMLGFKPDRVILISDHDAATVTSAEWFSHKYAGPGAWPSGQTHVRVYSTGVTTVGTGISLHEGGDTIAADETQQTAGKHVGYRGEVASAGDITKDGVTIAAALQAADGLCVLIAEREDGSVYEAP